MNLSRPRKILVGLYIIALIFVGIALYRYFVGYPLPYWRLFKEPFFYPFIIDERKPRLIRITLPNKVKFHDGQKQFRLHYNASTKMLSKKYYHIWYDLKGRAGKTPLKNLDQYQWIITTDPSIQHKRAIFFPRWSLDLAETPYINPTTLLQTQYSSFIEREFCVAVKTKHNASFVDLLKYYRTITLKKSFDDVRFEKYRFVIIFEDENTSSSGNITKALILALIAGCIPVYFGAPDVAQYFNPARMISVRDFPTEQQCVSRVLQIEDHRSEWDRMLRTPNVFPDQLYRWVGWYFKHPEVFRPLYTTAPELECPDYAPLGLSTLNPVNSVKVINLDRSVDRWKSVQAQFQANSQKIPFERFPAIDGKKYKTDYESKGLISSRKQKVQLGGARIRELTNGEIGCYLSHMELFYALTRDLVNDFYCILEDDVQIAKLQAPHVYAKEAPQDWDIIYLGVNEMICAVPRVKPDQVKYVRFDTSCVPCTFAYMVRKRAAQFLLNFGLPVEMPIDHFIRSCSSNLQIYIRAPLVVGTDLSQQSTIGKR